MVYIDSSTRTASPMAALLAPAELEEEERGEFEEEEDVDLLPKHDEAPKDWLIGNIDNPNIAKGLDPQLLDEIGQLVLTEYNIDKNSRSDWETKAEKALKFVTQDVEPKQYPFPGASNIIWPLLTTASLQFAARAYPAIIRNRSVVKGVVWGSDKGTPATTDGKATSPPKKDPTGQPVWLSAPGEKRARADRIGEHMSWQLLEQMEEWEPQTDQLLHHMPILGGAVRKTYRDSAAKRNRSDYISLMNLVWNYHAKSFELAPRHTEIIQLYPNEIEEFERADEMFLPQMYGPAGGDPENPEAVQPGDEDSPHVFLEQHRRFDLDGDGYAEPYIVTVHRRSAKTVRIVARYDEDGIHADKDGMIKKIEPVEQYTLIPFFPNLDGGSYPVGFGHLLRPLNEAINSTLNQMFDAGHLQNAGGGFVSNQLSIKSGMVQWNVGRYTRVDTRGQDIRTAIYTMDFKGPSPVLFQLLGLLMQSAKEVSSTQDILSGDAAMAQAAPTTIMALVEQGMKLYTAIYKRVFRALKQEFAKLYRLNRLYLDDTHYKIGDEPRELDPHDYRLGGGVEPVGDPTMVTDMQKLSRAMIGMTFKDDPLINQTEIRRRLFDASNMDRIDELFAPPNPMAPVLAKIAMDKEQAEMARTRASEQKDGAQAILFMAQARSLASGPELDAIDRNLEVMRLHLEALNTAIKAADVQAKSRGNTDTSEEQNAGRTAAGATAPPARGTAPVGAPHAVPGLAAPPANGGVSQVPGGPEPQLPQGG